jgi:hypothetical protein
MYEAAHDNASPGATKIGTACCGGGHMHPHMMLPLSFLKGAFFWRTAAANKFANAD